MGRIINQIVKVRLIRSSFAICLIISIDFEGQELKSTKVVSPAAVDPDNLTEPTFEVCLNGLEQNIYLSILFQWFSQLQSFCSIQNCETSCQEKVKNKTEKRILVFFTFLFANFNTTNSNLTRK